jgi:hypothetical protein
MPENGKRCAIQECVFDLQIDSGPKTELYNKSAISEAWHLSTQLVALRAAAFERRLGSNLLII